MADVDLSGYNLSGVDPDLVKKVIKQESGGNPNATSSAGAVGLMQLMPDTAKDLGVTDRTNPKQSVEAGAKYLSQLLTRYGGDQRLALAAYNAGPDAVDMYGGVPPYPETQNYVASILGGKGATPTTPSKLEDVVPALLQAGYSRDEITSALGKKGYTSDDLGKFFPASTAGTSQADMPWYGRMGQGALDTLKSAITSNLQIPNEESLRGMNIRDPWHPSSPANVGQPPDPMYDLRAAIQQFQQDPARAVGGLIPFLAVGGASNPTAAAGENVMGAISRGAKAAGGYPATIGRFLFDRMNTPSTLLKMPGLLQSIREGIQAPDAAIAAKVAAGDQATVNWIRSNIDTPQVQELFQRNPNIAKALGRGSSGTGSVTGGAPRNIGGGKNVPTGSLTPEGQAEEVRAANRDLLQRQVQGQLGLQRGGFVRTGESATQGQQNRGAGGWATTEGSQDLRTENLDLARRVQGIRQHWASVVGNEMVRDGVKDVSKLSDKQLRNYAEAAGYERGARRGISEEMKPILQNVLDTWWSSRGRR